jgi:hypothetical protein
LDEMQCVGAYVAVKRKTHQYKAKIAPIMHTAGLHAAGCGLIY